MAGESQIRPIRFKPLSEDYFGESNGEPRRQSDEAKRAPETTDGSAKKKGSNFFLEYSYPAVVFDNICFSVEQSKQQANFLNSLAHSISDLICFPRQKPPKVDILKSVNLNVPYGSIFGLLGPSSCGKTTLLRCLVGLLEPSSGCIRLFCKSPGEHKSGSWFNCCDGNTERSSRSADSKVPGSNVGYMPQDLGLYEDFTIRQLLTMFGQYMKMNSDLIATRIEFMAQFLDLPHVDRQISSLSGGQKRRVSFAIACLHMPPLIILDEPTVGVDPLLRQSIWKYLRRLADEENKTIIITTHYIEEAAQADQVALMRAGEILVQDTPKNIIQSNGSMTLEEAFLRICNNVQKEQQVAQTKRLGDEQQRVKLYPQPKFNLKDDLDDAGVASCPRDGEEVVRQLKLRAKEKLELFDNLRSANGKPNMSSDITRLSASLKTKEIVSSSTLSIEPNITPNLESYLRIRDQQELVANKKIRTLRGSKMIFRDNSVTSSNSDYDGGNLSRGTFGTLPTSEVKETFILMWALLYKNYRRNVNSLPLLAFQFILPIIQMVSFSLCVGGRPTNVGLGLVNHDLYFNVADGSSLRTSWMPNTTANFSGSNDTDNDDNEPLSLKYLDFIDRTMLSVKHYDNLKDALNDVRRTKLWAVMEIGENFTTTITKRFDLDNFYQLDFGTIQQSIIKLYPDRSNKVLDMICHRSLVNSYRSFLLSQFEHFKKLPLEVKEPIYDIKPNLISNSIDGYTESIAAGLLASLTYIMAAGLTTFIMVVERSAGILERTFTSGINPVAYLLAHAVFRSFVMMIQIAVVMFLTFYILKQPLVGSLALAYLMLMTLNLTGISYGLLISSLVADQNGAALTIVSSLVVKITMSGILWPFEAIPRWLRAVCYVQPLTMPIQALKAITLKGSDLSDRVVQLGFLVSISWLLLFLTISAKRFKFYQH